jgi:hypothetical protein
MSVTLRAEGLRFQASMGKKDCETPSQWKKLGMVVSTYHLSNGRKLKIGGSQAWAKKGDPLSKITTAKSAGEWHKALSLYPCTSSPPKYPM